MGGERPAGEPLGGQRSAGPAPDGAPGAAGAAPAAHAAQDSAPASPPLAATPAGPEPPAPRPLPPLPWPARATFSAVAWCARTGARAASGPADRIRERVEDWGAHPARLVWTLLVSTALLAAVWPCIHYARGFWLHGMQWGFLVNQQNDYGEGPLFNQQVILYHLLFARGDPAYRGANMYQLGEHPPFTVGNYPPVFPLVAAIFMRFVGMTFEAGRLVSTLSILGASILVGLIVWQGTGQILPGILGFGILVTMRDGIWSWGPFNRVDSLALFWSMLTVFLVLRYAGTRKVWWAVPVAILTVYTRQSMVDGIFAAFCYLLVRDWRRAIPVAAVTAAAGLAVFVGLQVLTHGAFYLNTVVDNENAYGFSGALSAWRGFITGEGRFVFPLAVAGAAAGLLGTGNVLWPVWLAGSVFVFATIGKTGAASNYYFTLEAATAACAALFIGRLRTFFRRAPFPLWPIELLVPGMIFLYVHGTQPAWLPTRLPLVQRAMQLVVGPTLRGSPAADFANAHPSKSWRKPADQAMVDYLRTVQGPVLGIDFPWGVVVQGGHQLQWQPFEFSVASDDGTWTPAPFVDAINDRYYAIVVTQAGLGGYIGGAAGNQISAALTANYRFARRVSSYSIYAADGPPPAPPPTVPEPVPHPMPNLARALLRAVTHPGAVIGGVAATSGPGCRSGAAVKVDAGFTMVCLAFNEQIFGVSGQASPAPCFDQGGTCLDPQDPAWPNRGAAGEAKVGGVPFWMPATGGGRSAVKSAVNFGPEQQDSPVVRVPAGKYSELYVIGSAGNGPGVADITFNYAAPGGGATVEQKIDDWCAVSLGSPLSGSSAFLPQDRWDSTGSPTTPANPGCGVLEYRVPIPGAGKTLSNIVFTDDASNASGFEPNILAVTLR